MKKSVIVVVVMLAIAGLILVAGCTSPSAKAQKLYNEGKYEEVITQYGADPNMAAIVTQAKEKIAAQMLTEGKFAAVLELYPETAAAKEAKNKLAEQLFLAGNYAEVMAKYGDTPWAMQAKAKLDSIAAATPPAGTKPGDVGKTPANKPSGTTPAASEKEKAAEAEYQRIMAIKIDRARIAALNTFINDAKFAGTAAVKKAQADLKK